MRPYRRYSLRLIVAALLPVTLLSLASMPASAQAATRDIPKHKVVTKETEIVSARTDSSKTFIEPNGQMRTVIQAQPAPLPKVDANGMSLISSVQYINGTPTCHINSGSSTADCSGQTVAVGKNGTTDRSLVAFDLSAIYRNVNVLSASLALDETSSTNSTSVPLQLWPVTKPWTTSTTWTKATSTVNWTTAGGDFGTTQAGGEGNAAYTGFHYLPVTGAVANWVGGQSESDGFLLKTSESVTNVLNFASANNTTTGNRPTLTVDYDYDTSPRPWNKTFDQKIDDITGLSVNLANGNLAINALDIAAPGAGEDLQVTRNWSSLHAYNTRSLGNAWTFGAIQARVEGTNDGVVVTFPGGGSSAFLWNGTKFVTPPGINADIVRSGSQYILTYHQTGEVWTFNDTLDGYRSYLKSIADKNGNAINYNYNLSTTMGDDSWPVLTSISDSFGNTVSTTLNGSNQITKMTDWIGRATNYTITSGQLVTVTDSESQATLYDYDTNGFVKKVTTPEGRRTEFTYGTDGRVATIKRVTDNVADTGPTWQFTYNAYAFDSGSNSWLGTTVVTDPNSHATTYTRDTSNRVTKVHDANGHDQLSSWSANNAPATITDSLSNVQTLSYDAATGNLTKSQAPNVSGMVTGNSTTYAYTDVSHPYLPSQVTDPQGKHLGYTYNTAGNATKTQNDRATNNHVDRTYNADGTVATQTDANSNMTSYGYTSHRLTSIDNPSTTGDESFTYDTVGRVKTHVDGKSQTTTFGYDSLNRVKLITYNGASTVSFTYDHDGNLTGRSDATGTYTFSFDALQRPTYKYFPGSGSSSVTYDGAGNVLTYTDAGGTVNYGYDNANNLTKLAVPGGSCTGTISNCTTFGYDNNNRRTTTSYPNGVLQTFGYDNSARPKTIVDTKGASTLVSLTYSYANTAGNDQALEQSVVDNLTSKTTSYSYDELGHVLTATVKNSGGTTVDSWTYTYDGNGNRTSTQRFGSSAVSSTFNNSNELTGVGATTFSSDANANLTGSTAGFSASYNDHNQTTSITPAGGSAQSQSFADFGQHERTAAGSTTFLTGLLGMQSETTGASMKRYAHDPQGTLVGMNDGTNTYFYLFDNIGSVIGLTNSSGAIAQSFSYDPYGQVLTTGITTDSRFKFAGGEYDVTTKMYHFGERFYDPALGQWTQRDTYTGAFMNPVSMNRFSYADGNPINYVDPSGQISIAGSFVAAAAVVGGLGTAVGSAIAGGAACVPTAGAGCALAAAGVIGGLGGAYGGAYYLINGQKP